MSSRRRLSGCLATGDWQGVWPQETDRVSSHRRLSGWLVSVVAGDLFTSTGSVVHKAVLPATTGWVWHMML